MAYLNRKDFPQHDGGSIMIYQRSTSNKIWQARLKFKGERRYKWLSMNTTSDNEAAQKAHDLYHEYRVMLKHNVPVFSRRITKCMDEFEEEYEKLNDKPHMLYRHTTSFGYLRRFVGTKGLATLTGNDINSYHLWRVENYNRYKPKPVTIERELSSLRTLYKWAVKKGYIKADQVPDIPLVKYDTARRPAFTLYQYKKLFAYMLGEWSFERRAHIKWSRNQLRAHVLFLLSSGIRPGVEANSLKWMDLDPFFMSDGTPNVRITVNRGKGKKKRDVVPWLRCRKVLDGLRQRDKFTDDNDYIFCGWDGSYTISFRAAFKRLIREAGVEFDSNGDPLSLYSLRHTYATFSIRYMSVDTLLIANNMGHANLSMLKEHYGQVKSADVAEKLSPKNIPWL